MKILYGAGKFGKLAFEFYGEKNIFAFADKNHGGNFLGKPVIEPSEIASYKNFEVIICILDYKSAADYLTEIGIKNFQIFSNSDASYLSPDVHLSKIANHSNFVEYLSEFGNKKGMRVLEIGSRVVTGHNCRNYFQNAEYVGFDFYDGENVDVVGDAHRLSTYFDADEIFDIIFSSAVFEHLAMPWLIPIEISKLLKIGGIVFVETHFSIGSHERPWHFFQFSDMALRVLFNSSLGFQCIEAGFSNPMVGRFSEHACEYLRGLRINGLHCHSNYLGKKVRNADNFDWSKADLNSLVGGSSYPIH